MLSLSLLVTIAFLIPASLCSNGLVVSTTSGELHGFIDQSTPLVRKFFGIPYAEPPIGDLRFAPPQTKASEGVVNATAFGPSCMQQFSNSSTIYTAKVPQFLNSGEQSEDCLYLNVWAPALKTERPQELALPVFVYSGWFPSTFFPFQVVLGLLRPVPSPETIFPLTTPSLIQKK